MNIISLDNIFPHRRRYNWQTFTVHVSEHRTNWFENYFPCHSEEGFVYDRLINLCVLLHNQSLIFQEALISNLAHVDRLTILDTGSCPLISAFVKRVCQKDIVGKVHCEEFVDRRRALNRLLDLADDTCLFTVLAPDGHVLSGELRSFLDNIRYTADEGLQMYSDNEEKYYPLVFP